MAKLRNLDKISPAQTKLGRNIMTEQNIPPADTPPEETPPQEPEWLTVLEAAQATGYARDYLYYLIQDADITSRKRSFGTEVNMPSLRKYMSEPGRGPNRTPQNESSLPREVGFDDSLDEPLRSTHVRVPYAMQVLGVADVTVHKHLKQGSLAGMKVGRDWLVERESMRWWLPDRSGPVPGAKSR